MTFDPDAELVAEYQPSMAIGWLRQGETEIAQITVDDDQFIRRLLACWNACLGVPLDQLEIQRGGGPRWRH